MTYVTSTCDYGTGRCVPSNITTVPTTVPQVIHHGNNGGSLPFTGAEIGGFATVGFALVVIGTGLVRRFRT